VVAQRGSLGEVENLLERAFLRGDGGSTRGPAARPSPSHRSCRWRSWATEWIADSDACGKDGEGAARSPHDGNALAPRASDACYRVRVLPIEQTLRAMLAPREDVELAILFGSAARGALTGSSDVDLGVRWCGADPRDRDALLATIERSLGRTLDLVDLDCAPPQLRFEIARSGVVIIERGAGTWSAFRARAFLDWWEFRPIADRVHRAAIARLRANTDGSP
jgi:predicted nucleotidyltransferase